MALWTTNCDVTVEDVDKALNCVYGKPVGLIKCKHTHYKLKPVVPVRVLSIDIIFALPLMVTLVSPLNLLMSMRIDDSRVDLTEQLVC